MASDGAQDLARLLLRSTVGGVFVAHGVKHSRSLPGTTSWFESIGFRRPGLQARLSSLVEVGAGVALIAGAGTPLAAAAVIGTMAVAGYVVHRPHGFFITAEGYEYVLTLSSAAAATAALGSGRFSVDRLLNIHHRLRGARWAGAAIGLGAGGAIAQLITFWQPPSRPEVE